VAKYLPKIVYVTGVRRIGQVRETVPVGGSFILVNRTLASDSLTWDVDSELLAAGAFPGAVGTRVGTLATLTLSFRAAEEDEVVWSAADDTLHRRIPNRQSGDVDWVRTQSTAEKFVSTNPAVIALDPEGVYTAYAKIVAGVAAQIISDAYALRNIRDPRTVPASLIRYAASQVGARVDLSQPVEQQRASLEFGPVLARKRGSTLAVQIAALLRGFSSDAWEVHDTIAWPAAMLSPCTMGDSSDRARIAFSAPEESKRVVYFVNGEQPLSGDKVTLTITTSTGTHYTSTFEFGNDVAIGVDAAASMANLIASVNALEPLVGYNPATAIDGTTGAHEAYPHGYKSTQPGVFWPSQGLVVFLNKTDGTPLTEAELTAARSGELPRDLAVRVFPAYAHLKSFGTVREVPAEGVAMREYVSVSIATDIDTVTAEIWGPPRITTQPVGSTVLIGDIVYLHIVAATDDKTPPPEPARTYQRMDVQFEVSLDGGETWTAEGPAKSTHDTPTPTQTVDFTYATEQKRVARVEKYRARVSNEAAVRYSNVVTVTVNL
jgi:hypothetical protein